MNDFPIPASGKPAKKAIFQSLLTALLLLTGAAVSIYLFQHYLGLQERPGGPVADVCSAVFTKSCDNALQSELSMQAGLPLAGWGILYYAGLTLLIILPLLYGHTFRHISRAGIILLTLAGLIAAISLLTLMALRPALFCPLCTLLHLINISLFLTLNKLSRQHFKTAIRHVWGIFSRPGSSRVERWWTIGGVISLLMLFFSLYSGLQVLANVHERNAQPAMIEAKPILDSFYRQTPKWIPVYADDAISGDPASKVQIVVFSDFLCPSCKKFSRELKRIIEDGKGSYFVVFKNFPLSSACNPYSTDRHPLACNAALAGVAAQKKGRFWAYHDTLYATDPSGQEDPFLAAARLAGLDEADYNAGMLDEQAKMKISRDIEQAHQLGVNATPTVFLNGRPLRDMRPGILQFLIGQELKRLAGEGDRRPDLESKKSTDQPKRSL